MEIGHFNTRSVPVLSCLSRFPDLTTIKHVCDIIGRLGNLFEQHNIVDLRCRI